MFSVYFLQLLDVIFNRAYHHSHIFVSVFILNTLYFTLNSLHIKLKVFYLEYQIS